MRHVGSGGSGHTACDVVLSLQTPACVSSPWLGNCFLWPLIIRRWHSILNAMILRAWYDP